MVRRFVFVCFAVAGSMVVATMASAHPGHAELAAALATPAHIAPVVLSLAADVDTTKVSGQGDLKFQVLHTSAYLPKAAQKVLVKAHGGFAVDRRPGKGESYWALPGAGILQISADLGRTRVMSTSDAMRDLGMHNTTIWYDAQRTPFLIFPSTSGTVFTTTLDGKLVHRLTPPTEKDRFASEVVNKYFADGNRFVPTDVAYHSGRYYITTGYSELDFVLSAKINSTAPFSADWSARAFGGRGEGLGQFGTGHGITVTPNLEALAVSDRPRAELDLFGFKGDYYDTVKLPKGSFPCDVDYLEDYATVGCLNGPQGDKGAPIYLLKDNEVVSTILPKEELGLENFQHIHNAVMKRYNEKLYVIVQAWNPGDFAILEQVTD